jgi:geranylgeranyl diphosphate synthase type I
MYKSAGGNKDEEAIVAGIGSELQHAFALIHDDVCDRGDIRHGLKTVQELVKEKYAERGVTSDVEHLANSQAMLIGDQVLSWSYAALNPLKNKYKDHVITHFQDMAIKVVAGEMMDISYPSRQNVSDQELNKRDLFKTAADTFVHPMLMGAVLAGRENEHKKFCRAFGSLMGEVYQIQDDILDIVGEEGTPEHSDIREHQHTFLTQYVLKHGSNEEKDILKVFFSGKEADSDNESEVLKIVSKDDVLNYAKSESAKRIKQAKSELRAQRFPEEYETLWLETINFFEKRFD